MDDAPTVKRIVPITARIVTRKTRAPKRSMILTAGDVGYVVHAKFDVLTRFCINRWTFDGTATISIRTSLFYSAQCSRSTFSVSRRLIVEILTPDSQMANNFSRL